MHTLLTRICFICGGFCVLFFLHLWDSDQLVSVDPKCRILVKPKSTSSIFSLFSASVHSSVMTNPCSGDAPALHGFSACLCLGSKRSSTHLILQAGLLLDQPLVPHFSSSSSAVVLHVMFYTSGRQHWYSSCHKTTNSIMPFDSGSHVHGSQCQSCLPFFYTLCDAEGHTLTAA